MGEPNKGAAKTKEAPRKDVVKKDKAIANRFEDFKKFLSGARAELKKVHWPNRQQLVAYTGVVFISVATVGALIWIIDSLLSKGLTLLLSR